MRWTLLMIAPIVWGSAQAGDIYKCVDGKGRVSFTDQPCDNASVKNRPNTNAQGFTNIPLEYQADIQRMLNLLADQKSSCRSRIDYSTVAISAINKGSSSNPNFFVQCGEYPDTEVIHFSLNDAKQNTVPKSLEPISQMKASQACRDAARSKALNPETIDFSMILDADFSVKDNGASVYSTSFTVINGIGVEKKYLIYCRFDGDTLTESTIKPYY